MCLLSFLKPGITPDLDALAIGAEANPHGHGYAILTDETILVGRGMDAATVLKEFAQVRRAHPGGPALFHSRFATHGIRDIDNCHPFALGGDPRTVLAHNGMLPANVTPAAGDWRSDTRVAAEDFLPTLPFGSLDSWQGREQLEKWLGGDKLIILTRDPAYKHPAYIFNERHGHWDAEGRWYSNHSYLTPRYYSYPPRHGDDDEGGYCGECGYPIDHEGTHCSWCAFCWACELDAPSCECPAPEGESRYADLLDLETT
ncbi:hypothetical protein [Nocardia sp. NPDC050435]|uniref:hypothetical protein n=1 Tax=Nocardia sp. NPDC050435 TaxID=3155040 RepID=UPI0033DE7957